ncbi:DUF4302 domain-containing protein [Botryobacter ruber]|uniref:DUF4302 domain-containing protein n=1 Tax=Botryobacter ruber TaxID=2171629 RepID=UPI0013E3E847|nr:DUF4302 domain-containing protein [Botryobacter ruber]
MKKILFFSLLLISFFSGCKDDDDPAPGERPGERLNQALSEYKQQLVSAEHGWKAVLYPGSGGAYSFLFRFQEDNKVVMSADINAASVTPKESTYRLKTMQRPTLIFDTYNYLHILTDPDETISGGDRGVGLDSDFEYSFESVTPETITLRGNFRDSRLVLTRATADEAANFIPSIAATAQVFENMNQLKTYFKRLTIGGNAFDLSVDTRRRSITFSYGEDNALKQYTTNYFFTPTGITLVEPLTANGITITELNNVQYNAGTNSISFSSNNTAGSIREANSPAVVNAAGARSLLLSPEGQSYWATGGFETADDDDLFNVFSIPNMFFLVYWPNFYRNSFDLLGFVLVDPATNSPSLDYGPTATSRVTNDGRIIFTFNGNLEELFQNIPPVPEAYVPIVTATREQWVDAQGYYYVQESENVVVLVSAKDAKVWMRLFRQ